MTAAISSSFLAMIKISLYIIMMSRNGPLEVELSARFPSGGHCNKRAQH